MFFRRHLYAPREERTPKRSFTWRVLLTLALASCATTKAARTAVTPAPVSVDSLLASAGLAATLNDTLRELIEGAIAGGASPGAAVAVGRNGVTAVLEGYGRTDWSPSAPLVDSETIYDMASLTKVVVTTTLAMIFEERGELDIDRTVASYIPGLDAPEKSSVTVRQLLLHNGGFEAFAPLFREFRGRDEYLREINSRPLSSAPGSRTVYSDWDMILLQLVLESITGQHLDSLAARMIFTPLAMRSSMYNPPESLRIRVAPTEVDSARGGLQHGVVHDENAWAMGGVAGHAGLFSTASDLARFAQMLLNGGELEGVRILRPETVARWTARQGGGSSRALGWDTPSRGSSAGRFFSPWSFGHTGFTGTSIWIDPARDLFVILLTNRVNPTRANNAHTPLRRGVADAVQGAVLGARLVNWEGR